MKTTVIEQQNNLKKKRIVSLTGLKKKQGDIYFSGTIKQHCYNLISLRLYMMLKE